MDPGGTNTYFRDQRAALAAALKSSCLTSLEIVSPSTSPAPDVLVDYLDYPFCDGGHAPCRRRQGAYVRLSFRVGGEAVLDFPTPLGCNSGTCLMSGAFSKLVAGWCSYVR